MDIGSRPIISQVPYDGYRNPLTGGQDSNIDLDDDDMSRLQDIAPDDYQDSELIRSRVIEHELPDRDFQFPEHDRETRELDYFTELDMAYDSRHPDRYGWDQYGAYGGY